MALFFVENLNHKSDFESSLEIGLKHTNVIKKQNEVPVSSKKATFTSETRPMDPSASFGHGGTYLPSSSLNNSKTIYTYDIGRVHFFGKGNIIKDFMIVLYNEWRIIATFFHIVPQH